MSLRHFNEVDLFFGLNEVRNPCIIKRALHAQIIGSTGTGKTIAGIFPMILNDIRNRRAVIFIDPKGDGETFEIFEKIAANFGRAKDIIRLDLGKIDTSAKYNPLKVGSPSELKDKIVGSIIWTEEFYKKVSEGLLLEVFIFLEKAKLKPNLQIVSDLVLNKATELGKKFKGNDILEQELNHVLTEAKSQKDNLQGLRTDLLLWAKSDFGAAISDSEGSSALDWILENKLVYINLNTLAFEETARRFGRLVVQDIKTAVQRIQAMPVSQRPQTGVYIDEFSTIASSGFIDLLSKARSANVNLTLAHQSLGDLQNIGPGFQNQIIDNTDLKIIFRIDSPETSDFFARAIGTAKSVKLTKQTNKTAMGGEGHTGLGTSRETDEFIVSPNVLRRLRRGQAIVYQQSPEFLIQKVKLNPIMKWLQILENRNKKVRITWSDIYELLWA